MMLPCCRGRALGTRLAATLDGEDSYDEETLVYEGRETVIRRAVRGRDGLHVVRKSLSARHPTPAQRARLRHEFGLLEAIDSELVVRPVALEVAGNGPVLVMEDIGAATLRDALAGQPISLETFFPFARALVQALGAVHAAGVVHKDVNPSNVLWDPRRRRLQLIDFGLASQLSREFSTAVGDVTLDGTLAYVAPEQTGRTNRPVDWRADFYSLGATFYEVLTGEPPFQARDSTGMIHAHLARQPTPLEQRRPEVGPALSALVARLLAKAADDRYQSAAGIERDLAAIEAWHAEGRAAEPLRLAGVALTERFELPSKLYGRDGEIAALENAFKRAADGSARAVLVRGAAGSGKSALANELRLAVARTGGNFIEGKFDQHERDRPFAPLFQAVSALIGQINADTPEHVAAWRSRIEEAVGANGALLVDNIPELAFPNWPTGKLSRSFPPMRIGTDLTCCCCGFFRLWAARNTRWRYLSTTFNGQISHRSVSSSGCLLTRTHAGCSWLQPNRAEEVTSAHPVSGMLRGFEQSATPVDVIELTPLGHETVASLIADATRRNSEDCLELAQLLTRPHRRASVFFACCADGCVRQWKPQIRRCVVDVYVAY